MHPYVLREHDAGSAARHTRVKFDWRSQLTLDWAKCIPAPGCAKAAATVASQAGDRRSLAAEAPSSAAVHLAGDVRAGSQVPQRRLHPSLRRARAEPIMRRRFTFVDYVSTYRMLAPRLGGGRGQPLSRAVA